MAEACYAPGLLGVDAAVARLIAWGGEAQPPVEILALADAGGRVLAEDVRSPMPVPPEANSAMDGVAFCHAQLPASGELVISQRIPAGQAPRPLVPGTAARIFTGAVLPPGADTVVMQEQCEFAEDAVRLRKVPEPGANVRPAGQDIGQGDLMLARGSRVTAPALGLLASAGLAQVRVYRPLRVALLCTGDELLDPGEPWRAGRIYNSNRPMLQQLLAGWGMDVIELGRVPDTQAAVEVALQQALAAGAEVVLSTGGVSVGEEDHVRAALQARGQLDFWKVAIKPGKPVAVGRLGEASFIGLPGNPQSVFITALILARPFLLARQGQHVQPPLSVPIPAAFAGTKAGDRREYLRVRLVQGGDGPVLQRHPQQSSGALLSAVWADGLAQVEAGQLVSPGVPLPFLPLSPLFLP